MDALQKIIKRLNEIVNLENKEPLDQLGSYIVGALIADDEGYKISQSNELLQKIADLGSDLEISNGGSEWMQKDWQEVKELVERLNSTHKQ
jgi:hypothetical protein